MKTNEIFYPEIVHLRTKAAFQFMQIVEFTILCFEWICGIYQKSPELNMVIKKAMVNPLFILSIIGGISAQENYSSVPEDKFTTVSFYGGLEMIGLEGRECCKTAMIPINRTEYDFRAGQNMRVKTLKRSAYTYSVSWEEEKRSKDWRDQKMHTTHLKGFLRFDIPDTLQLLDALSIERMVTSVECEMYSDYDLWPNTLYTDKISFSQAKLNIIKTETNYKMIISPVDSAFFIHTAGCQGECDGEQYAIWKLNPDAYIEFEGFEWNPNESKEHKIIFTTSPTSSKNPALPREEIELFAEAKCSKGHQLIYKWTWGENQSQIGFDSPNANKTKWALGYRKDMNFPGWTINVKVSCDHGLQVEREFLQQMVFLDFGPQWELELDHAYGVYKTIEYMRRRAKELQSSNKSMADLLILYADRIYNAKIRLKENPFYNSEGQASCDNFGNITIFQNLIDGTKEVFDHLKYPALAEDKHFGSVASVLIHEIAHSFKANEWQAHHLQRLTSDALKVNQHVRANIREFFNEFPVEPGWMTPGYYNIMVRYYWLVL